MEKIKVNNKLMDMQYFDELENKTQQFHEGKPKKSDYHQSMKGRKKIIVQYKCKERF